MRSKLASAACDEKTTVGPEKIHNQGNFFLYVKIILHALLFIVYMKKRMRYVALLFLFFVNHFFIVGRVT